MSIKRVAKHILLPVYRTYNSILYRISEKLFLEVMFYRVFKYRINWDNPKTYNEKLQWLKLYWKNPIQSICADKYAVRQFVEERIGKDVLNELYAVYECVDDIEWEKLPNRFVLKATHGSAMNVICTDKSTLEISKIKKILRKWLRTNYEEKSGEWVYKDIPKRIICEQFLENEGEDGLTDYKVWCTRGIPRVIQIDYDRYGEHKKIMYDAEWKKLSFVQNGIPNDIDYKKPSNLDKLLEYASILSEEFPYARVDFYNVNGKLIFGEITFYPSAGFLKFEPKELDEQWGNLIELPERYV